MQSVLSSADFAEAESRVIKIARKQKDNKYTNFFRNFKFFYERAKELSDSQLNIFTKTLTESCEVIEIKSWQTEQAITMFNSLNSDGLPLYDSDIISAKLYAAAKENGTGDEFTKLWKELIGLVNELKRDDIADIDAILMQQMYYERAKNSEMVSQTGSINVTTPGLRRYFTDINRNILRDPVGLCKKLINLALIWKKTASYPMIRVLLKFNDNAKLFLASYFHRFTANEISEDTIKDIVECLLKLFAVLELVDIVYSSSAFKTFLFGEIVKLADGNVPAEEIKKDFDRHIHEKWSKDKIRADVIEYDKNMLVYLNEYLYAKEYSLNFNIGTKCDIEHIMPISGANIDEIRKDAQIESTEEFEGIVNKLGNKILLEEKINRAIGNEWFRTKVSTKLSDKTGYVDSSYPIASALVGKFADVNKPYWCKKDIEDATEKIGDRIIKFIFGDR